MVSDTSPLRALHHLQLMHLLPLFYSQVLIPPIVVAEFSRADPAFLSRLAGDYAFIQVRSPAAPLLVPAAFAEKLDAGEMEAISLALEIHADVVLIDESAARAAAIRLGLKVSGVLALLARAKLCGHVAELRPLIEDLEHGLRFFMGQDLKQKMLAAVGE